MTKIVLANKDYVHHMTSEGNQLQEGLAHAGWELVGYGYGESLTDVGRILEKYDPDIVFVQDKRDWDRDNDGCFNPHVHFANLNRILDHRCKRLTVVKDAGSVRDYQREFVEDGIRADAVAAYYHPKSVIEASGWVNLPIIRTYHSVDVADVRCMFARGGRKGAIVTGADSDVYPLRKRAVQNASRWGLDVLKHPGYGNTRCHTPEYLDTLAGYKCHFASASKYGFALRKIIESVCCGCNVVTDLPEYDELPVIDKWLIRIGSDASDSDIRAAIQRGIDEWDQDEAIRRGSEACEFYDWRASGLRLDQEIVRTLWK